jgi:large subunit ribosomal protein L14
MIQLRTILDVADNTGAKRASFIGVLGKKDCRNAEIGDIINVNIKESAPEAVINLSTRSLILKARACSAL